MAGHIEHRGYRISQHGERWRWEVRTDGGRLRPTFASLALATAGLDDFLDRRDRAATREQVRRDGGPDMTTVLERWFADKQRELAPSTAYLYRHHLNHDLIPGIGHLDADLLLP